MWPRPDPAMKRHTTGHSKDCEAPGQADVYQRKAPKGAITGYLSVHTQRPTASDVGKRARGGTRTGFQPLNFRHSPANIANPGQSGTSTTQSEAQGVHIVHTPFLPTSPPQPRCLNGRPGGERFRRKMKNGPLEPDRRRMCTALRGSPPAGNRRTSWWRVPPFRTSHGETDSDLHDQPTRFQGSSNGPAYGQLVPSCLYSAAFAGDAIRTRVPMASPPSSRVWTRAASDSGMRPAITGRIRPASSNS